MWICFWTLFLWFICIFALTSHFFNYCIFILNLNFSCVSPLILFLDQRLEDFSCEGHWYIFLGFAGHVWSLSNVFFLPFLLLIFLTFKSVKKVIFNWIWAMGRSLTPDLDHLDYSWFFVFPIWCLESACQFSETCWNFHEHCIESTDHFEEELTSL